MAFKLPEEFRVDQKVAEKNKKRGIDLTSMATTTNSKYGGYFFFPMMRKKEGAYYLVKVVVADGWNSVAVNIPTEGRSPTWEEMTYIRQYFWDDADLVMQFLPPNHIYIGELYWLHLWSPIDGDIRTPDFLLHNTKLPPRPLHVLFGMFWRKLWSAIIVLLGVKKNKIALPKEEKK